MAKDVASAVQDLRAELQIATQLSAIDGARDGLRSGIGFLHQLHPAAVEFGGAHAQRLRHVADDQWLSTADKYIHRTVVLHDRGNSHQLRKLVEQVVAGIQQIVRRLAASPIAGQLDIRVQARDAGGNAVDLTDRGANLVVGVLLQRVQPQARLAEAVCQRAHLGHQQLAGRQRCRIVGDILPGPEKTAQRGCDSGVRVPENIVDLTGEPGKRLEPPQLHLLTAQLVHGELVEGTPYRHRVHAVADETIAIGRGLSRRQFDTLPAVAVRIRVGDVVARGGDGALRREQTGETGA